MLKDKLLHQLHKYIPISNISFSKVHYAELSKVKVQVKQIILKSLLN